MSYTWIREGLVMGITGCRNRTFRALSMLGRAGHDVLEMEATGCSGCLYKMKYIDGIRSVVY